MEPIEFTLEHVLENSPKDFYIFGEFLSSREPYKSLYKHNPWLMPPDYKRPLEWGTGGYWDTTVARKHDYWKGYDFLRY